MKSFLILAVSASLMACSTHKNKTRSTDATTFQQQHSRLLLDTADRWMQRIQLTQATHSRLEVVDVVPQGIFRYHPDSGYTGEAETVTIHRFTVVDSTTSDSLSASETSAITRTESGSIRHETIQAAEHEQLARTPIPIQQGWWLLLLVALLLLGGAWLFRKIREKL